MINFAATLLINLFSQIVTIFAAMNAQVIRQILSIILLKRLDINVIPIITFYFKKCITKINIIY